MDRRREALVGFVVLLGIAVAVVGTIWMQGGWRRSMVEITTASATVGQLVPGASVRFRGVAVGRVEEVRLAPSGDAVLVDLSVDPGLALPENVAVLLAPESLFGDWQAEILSRADFPQGDFLDYPQEGVLPGAALPDFSRLTATADEIARNLTVISDRFELAFTEETALNLKSAIDNIGAVSDGLNEIITQQAERFEDLSSGVNASAEELGAAARSARISFERIDSMIADFDLGAILANAEASVGNVRTLTEDMDASLGEIRSAAARADSAFVSFNALMAVAERGEGSLGRLLGDPALVDNASEAIEQMRALLADIQENPKKYLSLSIF